ncbi:MAG: hypothetical protein ACKOI1_01240, partial [Bacteroidota bacterium]
AAQDRWAEITQDPIRKAEIADHGLMDRQAHRKRINFFEDLTKEAHPAGVGLLHFINQCWRLVT